MANSEPTRSGKDLSDRVRSLRLGDRPGQGGARRASPLPWAVAAVLLLTTAAFGYRAYRVGSLTEEDLQRLRDGTAAAPAPSGPSTGGLTSTVAGVGEVVLQQKGYVTPISLIQVSPKVGGQLVWLAGLSAPSLDKAGKPRLFEEGAVFNEGDILAKIEAVEYQAEYDQAKAAYEAASRRYAEAKDSRPEELKQAQAELEEAKKTGTQLKLELDRNMRLRARSAISEREMEQARYASEANEARVRRLDAMLAMVRDGRKDRRVEAAKFEMNQANALLTRAKWRLDNTVIKAPLTGTILTKKAELGNIVNPSAFSSGISASLCEMADLTRLEVDLSIQERDIAGIKKGQRCLIMPEAYANDKEFLAKHPNGYQGSVSRLMPTADRAKGAIPVRVVIQVPKEEAGVYLRPDMGALVSFLKVGEKKDAPGPATAGEKK